MPRSHSIYIVIDPETDEVVSAFTVKKEMNAFIALNTPGREKEFRTLQLPDGGRDWKVRHHARKQGDTQQESA